MRVFYLVVCIAIIASFLSSYRIEDFLQKEHVLKAKTTKKTKKPVRHLASSKKKENLPSVIVTKPAEKKMIKHILHKDKIEYFDDKPFSQEEIEFAKRLFFDPRLSVHQKQSCTTCHSPACLSQNNPQ